LKRYKDLTNQKFERLTVKYECGRNKHGQVLWYCECDCGGNTVVVTSYLTSGKTKSCGCLRREMSSERIKKQNISGIGKKNKLSKYEIYNDYIIGYTSNTNKELYIDTDDYNKIKNHTWYENDSGYALTRIDYKLVRMHRLILNLEEGNQEIEVDHINHNTLDNRKINLRIVNRQKNSMNKNSKGITYQQDREKWVAQIKKDNKTYYLGRFDNKEDAINARKQAEEELFGEYSYDNSLKYAEQYKIEI
jgi:hypothetical protein